MFFKCKHPANMLFVLKDATIKKSDKYPNDFNGITYHLRCHKCGENIDIKYAQMIGGVDAFMARE